MVDNSNKLESGWLTTESKISIVVPFYNEEATLSLTIETLANQTKKAEQYLTMHIHISPHQGIGVTDLKEICIGVCVYKYVLGDCLSK